MQIYFTHSYNNEKDESHLHLTEAAALFLDQGSEYGGPVSLDECSGCADPEYRYMAEDLIRTMVRGEQGKPYIPGFAYFSISHSFGSWAVLFSQEECGLDIQYPRKADYDGIARRYYHPRDAACVKEHPESFFRLWTRREALIKAAGVSVADTDLPSVLDDRVFYRNREYLISEVLIPGAPELYASACFAGNKRG